MCLGYFLTLQPFHGKFDRVCEVDRVTGLESSAGLEASDLTHLEILPRHHIHTYAQCPYMHKYAVRLPQN